MSQPNEETVFDYARYLGKTLREQTRIGDHPEAGVEDQVSLIRDENMAVRLVP